jgi:hypothetical protein
MKTKAINTRHVYLKKNESTVYFKENNEEWYPINFQWIPVVKLNNELKSNM